MGKTSETIYILEPVIPANESSPVKKDSWATPPTLETIIQAQLWDPFCQQSPIYVIYVAHATLNFSIDIDYVLVQHAALDDAS